MALLLAFSHVDCDSQDLKKFVKRFLNKLSMTCFLKEKAKVTISKFRETAKVAISKSPEITIP